jgi:hypothetical protein
MAAVKPPLSTRTTAIIATMPITMIVPWMKSLTAVAKYPPTTT